MQRLILEFTSGDGYTFSCENTLPLVYENKEQALFDLELLLIEYQEWSETHRQAGLKLEDIRNDAGNHLRKVKEQVERNKKNEKELEKALTEWQNAFAQCAAHSQVSKERETFIFGGQKLHYESFFYYAEDSRKMVLSMPEIMTLEEFFAEVENSIEA